MPRVSSRSSRRSIAGFLLLAMLPAVCAAAQTREPEEGSRLREWLDAIEAHQPGDPGKPAVDVSTWSGAELEAVIAAALRHARALARQDAGEANRLLLRGAALHADIGRLIPNETTRRSPLQQSVYTIKDGRWQGVRYISMHWRLGRMLLDGVIPAPAADPGVQLWYRETSRDLLRAGTLVEAQVHLARGRQLFPKDPVLLFHAGVLHERYSSSLIQAGSDSLTTADRGVSSIGSAEAELRRAERFYGEALAEEPGHLDARIRHGRVLELLGQHEQAAAELTRGLEDGAADELAYFAHLFLGRSDEALGRFDGARAELERAAAIYPRAQTPRLGLSQLARRAGNRAAARRELAVLASLPDAEREREDPWWHYYELR